ncbi:transglutaminase-like cysteine peptidase [Hoeflea marina]|nr:transglutaminase-like cysteine peptidase [Hoeflea marina]
MTSRPFGHIEFCARQPNDCRRHKPGGSLSASNLSLLQSINTSVNKAIKPVSDIRQFGKPEYWTSNTKAGDCEDFALAKRAALKRRGFRASDLLLTMAYKGGQAHTVLVVRTRDGDFVLDNLNDRVVSVDKVAMSFVKMQAPTNGANWVTVTGKSSKR